VVAEVEARPPQERPPARGEPARGRPGAVDLRERGGVGRAEPVDVVLDALDDRVRVLRARRPVRLRAGRPGEEDERGPGGPHAERFPRIAQRSTLRAASPAERELVFSASRASNQSRGTSRDQTSLLRGWACPPATQSL